MTSLCCALPRQDAAHVADLYWEYTLPIRKFMIDPSEEGKLVSHSSLISLTGLLLHSAQAKKNSSVVLR